MIETERVSLELAYDRLKKSRPAIQPNPGFMSQLADFQEHLEIQQLISFSSELYVCKIIIVIFTFKMFH